MRRASVLTAIGLALGALLTAPATGQAQTAADYWTPEKMRAAVPIERLITAPRAAAGEVLAGLPEIIPAAFPTTGAPWTGGGDVVKTAGRVFFTMGGQNASCSGDAVTSANKSTVITAGHCVKYQGAFHTNWVFVPAYDNGNAPYGEWPATSTLTTPQWEASEDMNYDVGAAVVDQVGGQSLTDVVGSQGIAFNQPRNQNMYTFGYPAADPYDGTTLIHCSGSTFTDFLLTQDHGMACGMTGGSSGGPWFLQFDESTGRGVQASVNSFGYVFLPGYMFGPYFGAEAQALYNEAQAA
ncbi:serine protease [Amycolatopsis sp. 195334CR]|uniref:trypsin-like serine peptidase n=1 Tax=Amycolatopsis sp. 195334CR TaxID=2814588 RepID=UPI001A8D04B5|nr:peptidase [Amycolatopsis sp. 195334CR]MBN6041667.1 peptidase [Amycolatopsis sp. 195334CR]